MKKWIFWLFLAGLLGFVLALLLKATIIVSVSGLLISAAIALTAYRLGIQKDSSLLSVNLGETYRNFVSILLLILSIAGSVFFILINFIHATMKF
ncbi:hypothetical protein BAU15_08150 [Enterococcus sp. JM4C]|uniref:hypothetical protein n=1 Tax=Candidatus Enterococcus huntleyi TaxID=1857217 RepID=UPI00137B8E4F|nr:hypothetical protein [Enterococcus sp. JM4C]KAF1297867.1 hypothetical protein BAU15_08150 [Enterococcus sp. JM4C]